MYILLKVVWSGINAQLNPKPISLLRTVVFECIRLNWTDDNKKVEDLKVIGVRVCC